MKAALLALAMVAAPVVALAQGNGQGNAYANGPEKQGDGGTVSVPEIDPTAITGPLALLATGTLILTDRLRRKQPCRK